VSVSELTWAIARETPHLRRYARALVGDATQADDLVQDCLERAIRKRHLWARRGSLRSWLFRILLTGYLNGRARRQRDREAVDLDSLSQELAVPPQQLEAVEARDVIHGLARLPSEQRATILLVALEGLAYDEAADVLGVPIGTVRSRLWRGREALRRLAPAYLARPVLRRVK
jgi:RNA polymerase sigma-70 factor, ECF subfamily